MAFVGSLDNTGTRVLFKVPAGSKWGTGTVGVISMMFVHGMMLDVGITVAAHVAHAIHADLLRHVVFLFAACEPRKEDDDFTISWGREFEK